MAEAWEKDLVNLRVSNVERKGDDIRCSVNGRIFILKNNKVTRVPRAVAYALDDAVMTEYQIAGEIGSGKEIESNEVPRVMTQILSDAEAARVADKNGTKERAAINDIVGESEKKPPFSKAALANRKKPEAVEAPAEEDDPEDDKE
jgi:hypothetical protein